MRLAVGFVALVAALQCFSLHVSADGEALSDIAVKKVLEESIAVPVGEFWKDAYDAIVRRGGSKAARRLRYLLAGTLGQKEALSLARFLMEKMKKEMFNGRVNKETWDKLAMELYEALSEWWSTTPENPRDAADLGAWHSLINLQKNVMGPALRGSSRLGPINDMLLDPDLDIIRRWVAEWKGAPPPPSSKSSEGGGGTGGKGSKETRR